MAKKSKGNRIQVILECTEHKDSGLAGTSRYMTYKNRKNTTERLELKKFNPKVSKNARTDRGAQVGSKDYVRVIKAVKGKSGAYGFLEKIVHKDKVQEFLKAQS
jgi:large subunit ribosomal protein L33